MAEGTILAELILQGDKQFRQQLDKASGKLDAVKEHGAAVGAAMIGAGAALGSFEQSTQEARTQIAQTAVTLGITQDEATAMATAISDTHTPIGETTRLMDLLADRGVDSRDEMEALSEQFSDLAVATGSEAPVAAQTAIQSMRAFGLEMDDVSSKADVFTFVARNTSLELDEFGDVTSDIQPFIDELGLTIEDTAAIMAAMEEEGVGAQKAQELMARAAEGAEGDTAKFMETLGLTEQQIRTQRQALDQSTGSTQRYAQAAEGTVGITGQLMERFNDVKLQLASMGGVVDAAGPALMALGSALMVVSSVNFGAVIPSLMGVWGALVPLLPVILPLIAIAGVLALAWETNFLGIQQITADVVEGITAAFDFLSGVIMDAADFYISIWSGIIDALVGFIDSIPGIDTEQIIGDIDTQAIKDTLFPPKPEVEAEGEEVGQTAGEAVSQGAQSGLTAQAPQTTAGGGGGIPSLSAGNIGAIQEAVSGPSGGTMGDMAQVATTPTAGAGAGQQAIQMDARVEEGAIVFNGVTWEEAMSQVRSIIEDRISSLERKIKRIASRGGITS